MAESVVEYFKQPQVKKLLAKFKDAGLNLSATKGKRQAIAWKAKNLYLPASWQGSSAKKRVFGCKDQGGKVLTTGQQKPGLSGGWGKSGFQACPGEAIGY